MFTPSILQEKSDPLDGKPIVGSKKRNVSDNIPIVTEVTSKLARTSSNIDEKIPPKLVKCIDENAKEALIRRSIPSEGPTQLTTNDSSQMLYTMPAGSFKVILIVDNRESYG